jgi:hypothetical protein
MTGVIPICLAGARGQLACHKLGLEAEKL